MLGNAANFTGLNYFQALTLQAAKTTIGVPWAVEFWMQVQGDVSGLTQDYLINFGTSPGGDNSPAFIYDYLPDQLEMFMIGGRSAETGPTVADNNWHHVMWVLYGDGTVGVADRLDAWLDGVNVGNFRGTFSCSIKVSQNLLVGAALPGGIGGFEGRLDELAVYDLSSFATEEAVASQVEGLVTRHIGAATNPPPVLSIGLTGTEITISWDKPGFILQENDDLADSAGWTNVSGGGTSPVKITLPATGKNFYRLRQQ